MVDDEVTSGLETGKATFTEHELQERELAGPRDRAAVLVARPEEEIRGRVCAGDTFGGWRR